MLPSEDVFENFLHGLLPHIQHLDGSGSTITEVVEECEHGVEIVAPGHQHILVGFEFSIHQHDLDIVDGSFFQHLSEILS